jgi:hypothetical protein
MKTMKTEIDVTYDGEDGLCLHTSIGKGNLSDGRECQMIQTDFGIHMDVTNKGGKGWKRYTMSYANIGKAFDEAIKKTDQEAKQ